MARHTHLEHSEEVAQGWPLLTEAIGWVGHAQIRNRGTIGGSVAHADPAAELPAAFAALDATFHVRSKRGSRIIGWNEFFVSEFTTALAPDELVTAVEVPALDLAMQACFLAVLLGLVVLLAFFEEAVRGVVVRCALGRLEWVRGGVWRVRVSAVA
jgi:CO/xanthine dehydrogenase FAD-binding subunit